MKSLKESVRGYSLTYNANHQCVVKTISALSRETEHSYNLGVRKVGKNKINLHNLEVRKVGFAPAQRKLSRYQQIKQVS